MANVHFFTDIDFLNNQTDSQAYGPVKNNETTQYRVSSKLNLSTHAPAYAVTTGAIFIQPVAGNSSLVNIVLIPHFLLDIENSFTPVQYFIYRGIRKVNILNGDDLLSEADPNASDLVKKIWQHFNTLKADQASGITTNAPNNKSIGWDKSSMPDNTPLVQVLHQIDNNFRLTHATIGLQLGFFDKDNGGFEIVLKDRLYFPNLGMVRLSENIVSVPISGETDIPGNEPIQNMRKREEILNYIDTATYYMLFDEHIVIYKKSNQEKNTKTFSEIYQNIASKFFTKNTVYIDIRNENGYSLNYYKDNEGDTSETDFGKHIQISWDGNDFSETIYYRYFWPVLSVTPPSNNTHKFTSLYIKFRKQYNPKPLIYVDYGFIGGEDYIPNGSEKFIEEPLILPLPPQSNWSEAFHLQTPNIPSLSGDTNPTFILKIFLLREKQPSSLPPTAIPKNSFIDNVFGPVQELPSFVPSVRTQWEVGLGKKFIDGRFLTGFDLAGMAETGIGGSGSDVVFFAIITDQLPDHKHIFKTTPVAAAVPVGSGTSFETVQTLAIDALKVVHAEPLGYTLRKKPLIINSVPNYALVSVFGGVGDIDEQSPYLLLNLSKNEYNSLVSLLGVFDTNLHDIFFQFSPFDYLQDDNNEKYYRSVLKVSGLNNAGVYDTVSTNIEVLSRNLMVFNTQTAGNQVTLEDEVEPLINIDDFISYLKVVENIYNDSVLDTCTRLRVHYYGKQTKIQNDKAFVFENSIPSANYNVSQDEKRKLYAKDFSDHQKKIIYEKLISNASENLIADNPSPYLFDDNNNLIDLGQILYGFESVIYQPDFPDPQDSQYYSPAYEGYPIRRINDLAGWVANVATPIAETIVHYKYGGSPHEGKPFAPATPDINQYYNISAPDADIFGNADAIGIFYAYHALKHNSNLKLSDVFTLYYKGSSALDPNLTVNPPPIGFYTVTNRWLLFALHFRFIEHVSGNQYNWLDDQQHATRWNEIKSLPPPLGEDYNYRLYRFAEFWYNVSVAITKAVPVDKRETWYVMVGLRLKYEQDFLPILRFSDDLVSTELILLTTYQSDVFENIFLPFVKNKILFEKPEIIFI